MVISDAMVGQELRARPPASKVYPAELLQQIHILDHVLERFAPLTSHSLKPSKLSAIYDGVLGLISPPLPGTTRR